MSDHPEVTAIEDLMREHGLLNRLLLIYEEIVRRIQRDIPVDNNIINYVAKIIRKFIEEYHEKTEENYVFPKLVENGLRVKEVEELIKQHNLGRQLTDNIMNLTKVKDYNKTKLISHICNYIKMYRIHETREDTVIYQDFRKLLTKKEYDELAETFEKDEEKKLGKDGYDNTLKIVEKVEKYFGIYELSKVTIEIKQYIY
ncbi:MAG: hemerythrin [Barrevirus sp.]|uniref:Hemerythrin n=1 Tax=Barrevirus sp. TaxID=2487763 RepID=A0A3G4ZPI7_9VIRU|nr:MAG: hemerythrin [Barrevirus sp.]